MLKGDMSVLLPGRAHTLTRIHCAALPFLQRIHLLCVCFGGRLPVPAMLLLGHI